MRTLKGFLVIPTRVASIAALLGLCLAGHCDSVLASPSVTSMEVSILAEPALERLFVKTRLHVEGMSPGSYAGTFVEPRSVKRVVDEITGQPVEYRFIALPGVPATVGYRQMEVIITSRAAKQRLLMEYEYDRETFAGYAPNPSTHDNLHLGQLTSESIYTSHLYYYPQLFGGARSARIDVTVPSDWYAVVSGNLVSRTTTGEKSTFCYEVPTDSGRLPYVFAMYPYAETQVIFENRVPISIFHSKEDAKFASQKANAVTTSILPFLEGLMGPFPFESLKIVEVFPWEGNTGLAARGVVMLSQKVWFAGEINETLDNSTRKGSPTIVLVDEIAHQYNYYHVQLPNFLAEGVSQYTDALYIEHAQGKDAFAEELARYQMSYERIANRQAQLKPLADRNLTLEQASAELGVPIEEIAAFWPYASKGERPITDSTVFPALYFIKGALALHALRLELGDEPFFAGFRRLFETASTAEVTLRDFQRHFEQEADQDLTPFFAAWYESAGIPKIAEH